jgi:Ca2+-binding EF-hand superfamily protein
MRISTLGLSLILAAAPVLAQEPNRFGRGGMMPSPDFQALDLDRDRVISSAEIAKAADSLSKLDEDHDGKLTADEVRPRFAGRGRGGRGGDGPGEASGPSADEMVNTLMAFDKNGDGKLSKEEVPERMQGLFARADADHDGILTADEIRKSVQANAASAGPGGRMPDFMRLDPIFAAIDADGNGEITPAELAGAPAALKKLDKDGDGRLTPDEAPMRFGRGRGRQ